MLALEQAWTLLLLGPFLDRYISHGWVFNYDWNVPALTCLALSCACAVGVNVSQFMCLGRFSAVSYQVGCQAPACVCPLSKAVRARVESSM